jgi:hypothetical protein
MVSGGTRGYPLSLYRVPNLMIAPRIGFAYALSGDGRTALRGGAGVFYDRVQGNPTMNMAANPPTSFSPTLYYSTFDDLVASAGSALLAPSTISHSLYGQGTMPQNYQYTLGIQRMLGNATFVEVAYVGNFSRHLLWERNINPVPVGAQFLNLHPENRDPTTNAVYANNFLRPYVGYGDILEYEFGSTSNYNALQASMSTRMRKGLQVRATYTFGKALGSANSDTATVTPFFDPREWNYGRLTYSRTHVFTASPSFTVPRSWLPNNRFAAAAIGNWSVYGTIQVSSGQPYRPGFSTVDGQNFTGTPSSSATMTWVGPAGCATPSNCTLAEQFGRPGPTRPTGAIESAYWGNLGTNMYERPGINNVDMRLTRRFTLFKEGRTLELRGEAFNVFNHTQFSNLDTTARFDATGKQINALFLTPTAARRPRGLSLGVQVNF